MFKIEAHNMVICTCMISDDDEKRIRNYIKENPEKFEFMIEKNAIIQAIEELEIELYNDYVESDSYTDDIVWSSFEERSPEEILQGEK